MLEELAVSNLGVIESGHVEPGPGLVVITGETGTGKTLLAGAMGLLIGWPSRSGLIGPFGTEARVEGRFRIGDDEVVLARRLVDGRSRAYRNGEMVTVGLLGDTGAGLVEMVAQHDHLAIGTEAAIRTLVDRLLDDAGRVHLSRYIEAWDRLVSVQAEALDGDFRTLERARDLADYEVGEIDSAGFRLGEDAQLQRDVARLRNAGTLTEHLGVSHEAMQRAQDEFGAAIDAFRRAAKIDPDLNETAKHVEGVAAELDDLSLSIRGLVNGVEHDPEKLDGIERRLALLGDLRRKFGDSLDEILAYAVAAQARSAELSRKLDRAASYADDLQRAKAAAAAAGADLLQVRREAAGRLCDAAVVHLRELGFSAPHLSVEFIPTELRAHGATRMTLQFASDDRLTPGPVGRVASGGELSRLVLSLRLAGGAGDAPIVVFDEIDAGVGGRTALALGKKLAGLAVNRQVFVVTHLPQVAAFADSHFVVERDSERASIVRVDGDARIDEIARMLAGLDDSQQGRDHAAELVAAARGA